MYVIDTLLLAIQAPIVLIGDILADIAWKRNLSPAEFEKYRLSKLETCKVLEQIFKDRENEKHD